MRKHHPFPSQVWWRGVRHRLVSLPKPMVGYALRTLAHRAAEIRLAAVVDAARDAARTAAADADADAALDAAAAEAPPAKRRKVDGLAHVCALTDGDAIRAYISEHYTFPEWRALVDACDGRTAHVLDVVHADKLDIIFAAYAGHANEATARRNFNDKKDTFALDVLRDVVSETCGCGAPPPRSTGSGTAAP